MLPQKTLVVFVGGGDGGRGGWGARLEISIKYLRRCMKKKSILVLVANFVVYFVLYSYNFIKFGTYNSFQLARLCQALPAIG